MSVIPLSEAIRERTRAAHQSAENSSFISELMDGRRSREDYVALVGQQFFVYRALESVAEALRHDPVAGAFVDAKLTRLPAIEADLDFLVGADWAERIRPLPATERYTARIAEMAEWPGGFVAHHYTRYLGDLSGGQAIRVLLQRHYGFETNGIGFYVFEEIAKPKLFKDHYREQLDAAPFDEVERELVIAEAARAFHHNQELFADLERATAVAA